MFLACITLGGSSAQREADDRPNVVIFLVDDMGYSDIAPYGSEIPTPNLDALAKNGLRFTHFYNTPRCSPTRASLLTGQHPHRVGLGVLANPPVGLRHDEGVAGYRGYLSRRGATIAEVLREAGYHTYMTGKWHLGYHLKSRWPLQRGFDRFYGITAGASSYFEPQGDRGLVLDNEPLPPPEGDYYTTDAYGEYAVRFLREQEDEAPFFLYVAYNAPHWPLHARDEDIERFVGKYRGGWDRLRTERFERQKELGIVDPDWSLSSRDDGARPWSELTAEQKKQLDYRMAVYAAQIYRIDQSVGRVVDYLRKSGELDNTLILFLSDNGGCAEPYTDLGGGEFEHINDPDRWGPISYGQGWANASNTPFRRFKVETYEGGISTPLIAHWPGTIRDHRGKITDERGYLIDIMPTILDVTGAAYPERLNGYDLFPLEGTSLAPVFVSGDREDPEWMFWEHVGNRAVRWGDWKAVRDPDVGAWELFDLENDRTETTDLSAQKPELVELMAKKWEEWAWSHNVFPKAPKSAGAAEK